ncbi:MAG: hypothetical protein J6B87_03635 [Clostridia bacterium]|nr:hypothetical protein [Clostridia bacterium]
MSQKGISLIQLVIVIILLLIIASFALFSSNEVTVEARLARDYESLKMVKESTEHAVNLMEINPEEYEEIEIFTKKFNSSDYARIGLTSAADLSERSYEINVDNQEKLDLENITEERTYIVDLENKKYYILDGIEREEGSKVYEYVDVLRLYNLLSK